VSELTQSEQDLLLLAGISRHGRRSQIDWRICSSVVDEFKWLETAVETLSPDRRSKSEVFSDRREDLLAGTTGVLSEFAA
jgi:hypothetical protein